VCGDVLRKRAVGGGVNAIDAVAEHGNGRRVRRECTLVRGRIDALGKTANHAKATATEMAGKFIGVLQAASCRIATAHDSNRGQMQRIERTVDKERFRVIRQLREQFRIVVTCHVDDVMVSPGQPRLQ